MFRVTRYPMIFKTESGRVSKEIPGSGSGSGTHWALDENDDGDDGVNDDDDVETLVKQLIN